MEDDDEGPAPEDEQLPESLGQDGTIAVASPPEERQEERKPGRRKKAA